MGQKEKERLAEKFVKRSSMVNKSVQVDIDKKDGESQAKVAMSDCQIQVDRKWNSARKWEAVKIVGKVRHMFD
uniref:Uncharacterized protein n=1 Tax=Romanomermis culicivorax TaxID=13658 RepID=A0A915K8P4_ROMCU